LLRCRRSSAGVPSSSASRLPSVAPVVALAVSGGERGDAGERGSRGRAAPHGAACRRRPCVAAQAARGRRVGPRERRAGRQGRPPSSPSPHRPATLVSPVPGSRSTTWRCGRGRGDGPAPRPARRTRCRHRRRPSPTAGPPPSGCDVQEDALRVLGQLKHRRRPARPGHGSPAAPRGRRS
jgi:hypothetical protein